MKIKTLLTSILIAVLAMPLGASPDAVVPTLHLDSYQPNALILVGPHGPIAYYAAVTITVSNAMIGAQDSILFSGSDSNLVGPSANWQSIYSETAASNVYSVTVYPPMTNAVGYFKLIESQ